jgi:uncharacterized ubiquitin-like protein YukD
MLFWLLCKQGFSIPESDFNTDAPIRIETSATILSDSAKLTARKVANGKRDLQVKTTLQIGSQQSQILLNPKS